MVPSALWENIGFLSKTKRIGYTFIRTDSTAETEVVLQEQEPAPALLTHDHSARTAGMDLTRYDLGLRLRQC